MNDLNSDLINFLFTFIALRRTLSASFSRTNISFKRLKCVLNKIDFVASISFENSSSSFN
jgi:hypothetical protein